jgi:hypothetical protein
MMPFLKVLQLGQWDYEKPHFNCLGWFEFELTLEKDVLIGAKNAHVVALTTLVFPKIPLFC